uniref:P2X purinoceptor n=1 Tax=Salarias fasciatus TaxID=181472 RepID=A0A672FH28_SALFA
SGCSSGCTSEAFGPSWVLGLSVRLVSLFFFSGCIRDSNQGPLLGLQTDGVLSDVSCGVRSLMMLWNRKYQQFDLVVSSVTTKMKGVAQIQLPGEGQLVWDSVDYSGPAQEKNSFFVMTNVIVTKGQKQGKCPEVCSDNCAQISDCQKGASTPQSNGVQTGSCVKFDLLKKTCEVSAWCPVEATKAPALLAAAENFTVLIKNNIRFPAFNFTRRNILPWMNDSYLKSCQRKTDSLCPIFRLGDIVREAGESFTEMAVEGGVLAVQIKWDCNLDYVLQHCRPWYSFRRLDEKQSNKTLYPGLNFRFAKYNMVNGVEERTLYKAFGIRFDVIVFGQVKNTEKLALTSKILPTAPLTHCYFPIFVFVFSFFFLNPRDKSDFDYDV